MRTTWTDESTKPDVIAGLSAPSFVIVAAALCLTIAALAAGIEAPADAVPVVKTAAAAPRPAAQPEPPLHKP